MAVTGLQNGMMILEAVAQVWSGSPYTIYNLIYRRELACVRIDKTHSATGPGRGRVRGTAAPTRRSTRTGQRAAYRPSLVLQLASRGDHAKR